MTNQLCDDPFEDIRCDKDGIAGEGVIPDDIKTILANLDEMRRLLDKRNDPGSTRINANTIQRWREMLRAKPESETIGEDLFLLLCLDEIDMLRKERDAARRRCIREVELLADEQAKRQEVEQELKRTGFKVICLMAAGDRLLDHVVTQHHSEDVQEWWKAKEL